MEEQSKQVNEEYYAKIKFCNLCILEAYLNITQQKLLRGEIEDAIAGFTKLLDIKPLNDSGAYLYNEELANCPEELFSTGSNVFGEKPYEKLPILCKLDLYDNFGECARAFYKNNYRIENAPDFPLQIEKGIFTYDYDTFMDYIYSTAYVNQGMGKCLLMDYTEAITDFTKAIELEPHRLPIYDRCLKIYDRLNDSEGAGMMKEKKAIAEEKYGDLPF